ncbi:degenerin del-1-like [Bolinopsis microptera]|uniref:degenerin del-1-like n=1 Tax=Bolinopsis microptera TaxID=2820187 RepID=UPI00307A0BDF
MWRNVTYEKIIREAGPANSTFLQCEQSINICNDEKVLGKMYFEREASISGNCFRVNPEGKLRGKGGDYGKMRLIFFADLDDYSESAKQNAQYGYTVAFHDHETYSSTIPSGFFMSPGSIYKVDLSMVKEFREPPPAGSCDQSLVVNTYGRYEENSCIAQCRDYALIRECGCVLIVPPYPQNNPAVEYKACTLEQWAKCGIKQYKKWVARYSDVRNLNPICNCPPPCKETQYTAQLSSSSLNKYYAHKKVDSLPAGYTTKEDVMDNLLVIEIMFSNMQVSEIREIVTYGWGNFLGDVGGVLGLFLGCSAFTIIEFGQFFVFALAKWCFDYQGPKRSSKKFEQKNDNSNDATIEMELPKNLLSLQNGRS